MRRPLRRALPDALADQRGAVTVLLAFSLTALLGMTALGIEAGTWFATRRALQGAADAGAISGAFELEGGQTDWSAAARTDALRTLSSTAGVSVVPHNPPSTGSHLGNSGAVEVTVSQPQTLLLAAIFGATSITISARAVALAGATGTACVLALDKTVSSSLQDQGTPNVLLSGCSVAVNSSNSSALTVGGSATLTASAVNVVGGISGLSKITAPSIVTNGPAVSDPYTAVAMQAPGTSLGNVTVKGNNNTLTPGTYSSLTFNANSTATLSPGVYIINGGGLTINGGATVTGSGVTFLLTGSGSSYSSVTINGGANVTLTAPSSGPYAGIIMFGDRNGTGVTNRINGGSTTNYTGALYFPTQYVNFTGGNSATGCTQIIADTIAFSGNAILSDHCTGVGTTNITGGIPTLVE